MEGRNRVVRLEKPDGLSEARDFSHGFFTNNLGFSLILTSIFFVYI